MSLRRMLELVGLWFLARSYRVEDDPLAQYDNTSGLPCPSCSRVPEQCSIDQMTHDPCLGHIEGATSACCGHGLGVGYVSIGGAA